MKKKNWMKLVLLISFVLVSGVLFCCGCREPAGEYLLKEEPGQEPAGNAEEDQNKEADRIQGAEPDKDEKAGSQEVTAYIHGCVKRPGVYSLPAGSRLYELVKKAGGFSPKARKDAWNQAVLVEDGQQYKIPSKKAYKRSREQQVSADAAIPQEGSAGGNEENCFLENSGKVNLNTASREELLTLSGIGESKADAILSYREEQGRFQSVEEIMNISGIKEGVFMRIKDKITAGE